MERRPQTLGAAADLLAVAALVQAHVPAVIREWATEAAATPGPSLPSPALYDAQRTLVAAAGKLIELVAEPSERLLQVATQFWEARALHVLVEKRVADLLEENGGKGVVIEELASKTGIEKGKLSRLLRCLCSIHVFAEVAPDVYANNVSSRVLVHNEPLRAYILVYALVVYPASTAFPAHLLGPHGHSYDVHETAWQDAFRTDKPLWEWLAETVPRADVDAARFDVPETDDRVPRPEAQIFDLGMMGGGRANGAAHPHDYPWASLGGATVVDVGGGVGGFPIQLSHRYPQLQFVIQDRGAILDYAESTIWPQEAPAALAAGRVRFVEHDFFEPNPVHDADVYWLRYILHDWSDAYCVRILRALRAAISTSSSRVLVCDQVMNTTLGAPALPRAPSPLPANYGYHTRYSHTRDLTMMGIIHGVERGPTEFEHLAAASGFRIHKIWTGRSQVSIVELVIDESPSGDAARTE